MVAATAQADYAKLLFRTEPFSKMASARRFQLLSQARSVRFFKGQFIFQKGQPPTEVLLLLEGQVRMAAEVPGQDEPVHLGEYGPGSCVGWDVSLADVCSAHAIAENEVTGLLISAASFIEIARFDPALRDSFLFRPSRGEIWWAILSELQRRNLPIEKAAEIVEQIGALCTTRDWPDEESAIESKTNYLWIVSGGEGVLPGTAWENSTGVLWARLIGIPAEQFKRALDGEKIVDAESAKSLPNIQSGVKSTPEKPPTNTAEPMVASSPPRSGILFSLLKGAFYLILSGAVIAAGVCGWASRQPTIEKLSAEGKLLFSGDAHELNATLTGKLTELKLRSGQRVAKGAVLAIIQPPRDDAKIEALTATLAKTKTNIDVCERILSDKTVKPNDAPEIITAYVRDLNALKSELRIKNAINAGRTDDRSLTLEERAKVTAYFDTLKADRAARVDSAQTDSSIKREDLADAEQALSTAKGDLRLQMDAASALLNERGDEAKAEAASAQRAIVTYKRVVAAKQDAVTRIRKEIASIRVAPSAPPATTPQSVEKLEAAIQENEKAIRKYSASMRILAVDTEIAIDQLNADAAPRQITALHPGLITQVEALAPNSQVGPETVLGKMVTRQSWEVECPEQSVHFLKVGQELALFTTNSDHSIARFKTHFAQSLPAATKGKARIRHSASNDEWRDGTPVKLEAMVVTGNLLDRWLLQFMAER